MKNIISIIAAFMLLVSMSGCGKGNTNNQTDSFPSGNFENTDNDNSESDYSLTSGNSENTGNDDSESNYSLTISSSETDALHKNENADDIKTFSVNNSSKAASAAPAHTHYYTSEITKKATCGATGVETFTCNCGSSYTEVIPATNWHDWKSATCTEPKKCTICGKTEGNANGHNYNSSHKCYSCGQIDPSVNQILSKCSLELPSLPKTVSYYNYNNKLHSSVEVTAISYEFEYYGDGKVTLTAKFSGKKTYDYRGSGQSDSVNIGWKLYDPNGNVFRTGTLYSPSIAVGESFTNKEEDLIYNFEATDPGKFKLVLSDVN